jgi:hypothetical protein
MQVFIILKRPSYLAGFEPENLGSNGKHDSHYMTEDNWQHHNMTIQILCSRRIKINSDNLDFFCRLLIVPLWKLEIMLLKLSLL